MCRAIVLFATLWALAYNVVGAEITDDSIGNLHLVAVIDGCSVHGSAIAEDNDSCLFFLSDEKENRLILAICMFHGLRSATGLASQS